MRISIIIPAFNEEDMIGSCLTAIQQALRPRGELEILVVNNASTDRTYDIACSFPGVRVITEIQKGLTKARECGRLHSTGDLLFYIDADTLIPKHLIAYVEEQYLKQPDVVASSGPYKYHDWNWYGRLTLWMYHWTIVPITQLIVNRLLNKGSVFYGGNFVVRRSVLERIGGFDTTLEFWSEDTQIGRRMSREGVVRFFHKAYVYTSARRFYSEGMLRVLGRYIMNFLWDIFFHRPFTRGYKDVRSGERFNTPA